MRVARSEGSPPPLAPARDADRLDRRQVLVLQAQQQAVLPPRRAGVGLLERVDALVVGHEAHDVAGDAAGHPHDALGAPLGERLGPGQVEEVGVAGADRQLELAGHRASVAAPPGAPRRDRRRHRGRRHQVRLPGRHRRRRDPRADAASRPAGRGRPSTRRWPSSARRRPRGRRRGGRDRRLRAARPAAGAGVRASARHAEAWVVGASTSCGPVRDGARRARGRRHRRQRRRDRRGPLGRRARDCDRSPTSPSGRASG